MRKLIVLGAALSALVVGACDSLTGLGRDVEAAGQPITIQ